MQRKLYECLLKIESIVQESNEEIFDSENFIRYMKIAEKDAFLGDIKYRCI
jgi:hypothetical protein